jgi:O-antigen/teichoic acid export membrane protein
MLLAGLLDALSVRLQSLLIGRMFDANVLGFYTIAQNTQQAPTSFIGGILTRVGLPVFSRVADQPTKLLGALRVSLRCALFVFIPCMVGIALVARPLVELLYGTRWDPAAPILTLLALSAALWPLHVLNLAALSALGRSDLYFRLELIKKIIAVVLIVSSAPFGAVAVAASVLAASVFAVAINTWYSRSLLGYGMIAQLSDQRGTLALAAVSAACGWSVLHWNPPSLAATAVSIALAAMIYLGGAYVFRNQGLRELIVLIRGILAANVRPSAIDVP